MLLAPGQEREVQQRCRNLVGCWALPQRWQGHPFTAALPVDQQGIGKRRPVPLPARQRLPKDLNGGRACEPEGLSRPTQFLSGVEQGRAPGGRSGGAARPAWPPQQTRRRNSTGDSAAGRRIWPSLLPRTPSLARMGVAKREQRISGPCLRIADRGWGGEPDTGISKSSKGIASGRFL